MEHVLLLMFSLYVMSCSKNISQPGTAWSGQRCWVKKDVRPLFGVSLAPKRGAFLGEWTPPQLTVSSRDWDTLFPSSARCRMQWLIPRGSWTAPGVPTGACVVHKMLQRWGASYQQCSWHDICERRNREQAHLTQTIHGTGISTGSWRMGPMSETTSRDA